MNIDNDIQKHKQELDAIDDENKVLGLVFFLKIKYFQYNLFGFIRC